MIRVEEHPEPKADNAPSDYDIMREVFLPCLSELHMEETSAAAVGAPEREGRVFRMTRNVASGYFWLYAERDFAISATDMSFPNGFREQCQHPRFISVRYYLSGSYIENTTKRTIEAPYLEGHALDTPYWDCLFQSGAPLRTIEIMLAPPFYEQYLHEVYRDEALNVKEAFANIDGLADFPEMAVLLKQVDAYRGRGASAKLFYRSKAKEAVALIVDKSRAMVARRADELTSEDMHAVERVRHRLEQRLAQPVGTDELIRIACMGQTKLRRTFKQICGCTIVEYRQRARCAKAAELLITSDAPVAQVASDVGYRSGRLTELFVRIYHTTPSAYRTAMR